MWKEVPESLAEGPRKLVEAQQRDVSFTALDAADVGPVQLGLVGKVLLRPATGFPRRTDAPAECDQDRLLLPGVSHAWQLTGLMTMGPRTMSSMIARRRGWRAYRLRGGLARQGKNPEKLSPSAKDSLFKLTIAGLRSPRSMPPM